MLYFNYCSTNVSSYAPGQEDIYHKSFKRSHFSVPEAVQSLQVKWKNISPANWLGFPDFKQSATHNV